MIIACHDNRRLQVTQRGELGGRVACFGRAVEVEQQLPAGFGQVVAATPVQAAALNDNGTLMWRTGYGHGDALHVGDLIPSRAGIEVFRPSVAPEPIYDASLPNAAEWAAIVTDDPFYEPACRVVRFQDTMWLQLLAGVTLERAIPIAE